MVTAQVLRTAMDHHPLNKHLYDSIVAPESFRYGCQAFPAVLIDDVQPPNLLAVVGLVFNTVITPNMVPMFRPQTDTTAVIEPEPSSLDLLGRQLQAFFSPNPSHTFRIDFPAFVAHQEGHLAISHTPEMAGFVNHVGTHFIFIVSLDWFISVGSSVNTSAPANLSFSN